MQNLKIENFGAIKEANLNLKDVNIFIGKNAKGKSTIAKVISILSKEYFNDNDEFKQELKDKNIDFLEKGTILEFKKDENNILRTNGELGFIEYLGESTHEKNSKKIKYSSKNLKNKSKIFSFAKERIEDTFFFIMGISFFILLISAVSFSLFEFNTSFYLKISSSILLGGFILFTIVRILIEFKNLVQGYNNYFSIEDKHLEIKQIKTQNNSIYIPSERSFVSLVSNSLFNMIRYDIPIPKFILDFGAEFERALQNTKELKIEFLDITYKFENGEHRIYHNKKDFVKLSESASAIQTLIPMLLTIKYISSQNSKKIFVIEEPELNLYPIAQKGLVEFLVKECLQNGSKLIVTTHSPYILTAFNNLIQASNTTNAKPNLEEKVEEIISKDKWLEFERVGAWYVDGGTAEDIMDYEDNIIGANRIDDVSEMLGGEFDELIELMYGEE